MALVERSYQLLTIQMRDRDLNKSSVEMRFSALLDLTDFLAAIRAKYEEVGGWTDVSITVSLTDVTFDPADPTTYPAASSHFTPATGSNATMDFDASTGKYFLQWGDPDGGWVFTAATITTTIQVTGYVVKAGSNVIGANLIGPYNVSANGQTITLPYIASEVPDALLIAGPVPATI